MTSKQSFGVVSLLAAVAMAMNLQASAQETPETHVSGTLNDYVWVETGAGAGAWHVTGAWTVKANVASGSGEFIGSLLGVRSDLWVLRTDADPATELRTPHTHHVGLLAADVTVLPNGIRLEGTATITANGSSSAPYSRSMVRVDITGGDLIPLSNMKLTFLGQPAIDHFGRQPYDGVVVLER